MPRPFGLLALVQLLKKLQRPARCSKVLTLDSFLTYSLELTVYIDVEVNAVGVARRFQRLGTRPQHMQVQHPARCMPGKRGAGRIER